MWNIGHEACIGLCHEFPDQMRGVFMLASQYLLCNVFTHVILHLFIEELQLFLLEVGKDLEGNHEGDYRHDPRSLTL